MPPPLSTPTWCRVMAAESLRNIRSSAPAVVRSAGLLAVLASPDGGPMGLSDLARCLDLPKSTVANLCSALEQVGFITRQDGRYNLGPRLLELGAAYVDRIDVLQEFREASARLRWASQETVQLALLDGTEIIYLARHDGNQPIRLGAGIGRRMPVTCTALGKALLAEIDPSVVQSTLATLPTLPVLTPHSKRNIAELLEDLDTIRERGYAIDDEENSIGIVCYSVSLPTMAPATARRAISVTLLKARETASLREHLVEDLRTLKADLSHRL
jgi:DNA-binding IclR family transcriptional regulator